MKSAFAIAVIGFLIFIALERRHTEIPANRVTMVQVIENPSFRVYLVKDAQTEAEVLLFQGAALNSVKVK